MHADHFTFGADVAIPSERGLHFNGARAVLRWQEARLSRKPHPVFRKDPQDGMLTTRAFTPSAVNFS